MKYVCVGIVIVFLTISCNEGVDKSSTNPVNWENRFAQLKSNDTLVKGSTYLSLYSQIYTQTEHKTHDLTATVSIRNINKSDTIFIDNAVYYNTEGNPIRSYFNKTVFVAPMETIEIIIDNKDRDGGSGANFVFDWTIAPDIHEPFFECIMISTSGQQGISFSTQGIRIY